MEGPEVGLHICDFVLNFLFSVSDEVSSITCCIYSVLICRMDLRALLQILKGMLYRGVFYG